MQYSQKNFMRIIGNDQKNKGQNFWEILERIIGKISSIIGAGLPVGGCRLLYFVKCKNWQEFWCFGMFLRQYIHSFVFS